MATSQPPVMIVVAGPSGSGKSRMFPVHGRDHAAFNVDDRCRDLNGGSCVAIPATIRQQAQRECEEFIASHIEAHSGFAVETTLRSDAAIRQAAQAKARGFVTQMVYVATNDVEVNIERVARRAHDGGHAAPPERIREIYDASLGNLRSAIETFDRVLIYDNSVDAQRPIHVCEFRQGRLLDPHAVVPDWLEQAALR